jgi:hypothetical protein
MQLAFTIAQMLIRVCGVLLLILGLLIWAEGMSGLIEIHMLLGLILVLSMIVLGILALLQKAPVGLAGGLIVVALVVVWVGLNQDSTLYAGPNQWLVKIVHLLLGMGAVAMAEIVGGRLRRARLAAHV